MMTNSQLATASLNDIVFDGRNRHYGAYQLRALYQRHVTRALVIATAIFALLIASPIVARMLEDNVPPVAVPKAPSNPIIVDFVEPKIIPPPPAAVEPEPAAKPPQQQPTIKDVVPVVVEDKLVTETDAVPDRDKLLKTAGGLKTVEGDSSVGPNEPPTLTPGNGNSVIGKPETSAPYTYVEQMPELQGGGGMVAIVAAIQKQVKYPSLALRNGVEGRVYASFTVNTNGEVVDVKIVKGLGSGLDEETMRAIAALPKFIPGRQNGRDVNVSFTVPVTYKIQ
ncbi:MAG TPA: energy transducer TonB [Hymenobacter sp.]|jgi:protein TonB|uniref:energy transducer TonB n=1 Tax=Hymenobacter sp. TaxID=1898978 RepID=UPI002EDAEC94